MKTSEKRQAFETKLIETGWIKDEYGHYQRPMLYGNKNTGEKRMILCRIKMQATSYRYEIKMEMLIGGKKEFSWVRRNGAYYKDIQIKDTEIIAPPFKFPLIITGK